jgi:hypothetical protein
MDFRLEDFRELVSNDKREGASISDWGTDGGQKLNSEGFKNLLSPDNHCEHYKSREMQAYHEKLSSVTEIEERKRGEVIYFGQAQNG